MKKKLIFALFAMWTASEMRSQDTTDVRPVTFPFWMVQEIAVDLSKKERLEALQVVTDLELQVYAERVRGFEKMVSAKDAQIGLLQKNNVSLNTQLRAEQAKKPKLTLFEKVMIFLGGLAAGAVAAKI